MSSNSNYKVKPPKLTIDPESNRLYNSRNASLTATCFGELESLNKCSISCDRNVILQNYSLEIYIRYERNVTFVEPTTTSTTKSNNSLFCIQAESLCHIKVLTSDTFERQQYYGSASAGLFCRYKNDYKNLFQISRINIEDGLQINIFATRQKHYYHL